MSDEDFGQLIEDCIEQFHTVTGLNRDMWEGCYLAALRMLRPQPVVRFTPARPTVKPLVSRQRAQRSAELFFGEI